MARALSLAVDRTCAAGPTDGRCTTFTTAYNDTSTVALMATMPHTYSLQELAALVELPERTVRYYIQLGLVDRPEGETRAARYGERHLEQLLEIRKWQRAGLSLERIRELVEPSVGRALPRVAGGPARWRCGVTWSSMKEWN